MIDGRLNVDNTQFGERRQYTIRRARTMIDLLHAKHRKLKLIEASLRYFQINK
uniref:Uncharacterized protein n=1 Tax=Romanomermis culicivorax TaxID=13658 RepID=A0A915L386_ROMCU